MTNEANDEMVKINSGGAEETQVKKKGWNWRLIWPGVGVFMGVTGSPAFFIIGENVAGFWCGISGLWAVIVMALAHGYTSNIRIGNPFSLYILATMGCIASVVATLGGVLYFCDPKQRIDVRTMQAVWCLANIRWTLAMAYYSVRAGQRMDASGDRLTLLGAEDYVLHVGSGDPDKTWVTQMTRRAKCVRAAVKVGIYMSPFLTVLLLCGVYGAGVRLANKPCELGAMCKFVDYIKPTVK